MKRTILLSLFSLLFTTMIWSADFAGGSGTKADPYRITNRTQLNNLRKYLGNEHRSNYYSLTNDIDLSGSDWVPIGGKDAYFQGKFYGNGHRIFNLNIGQNGTTYEYTGLFGYLYDGADIDGITIASGNIKGIKYTGSIAACTQSHNADVYIWNCINQANIECQNPEGSSQTGGIVGSCLSTYEGTLSIYRCINNGKVTLNNTVDSYVGGIVGFLYSGGINSMGRIRSCINYGTITGDGTTNVGTGGIVGWSRSRATYYGYQSKVNILECANAGTIIGGSITTANTGGIIGEGTATNYSYSGGSIGIGFLFVMDCYSKALIHASSGNVGGIMGTAPDGFNTARSLATSYSAGSITGNAEYAGGLIGYCNMDLEDSFAVQSKVEGQTAHRVSGASPYGRETRNFANKEMLVNGNTITSSNSASIDGADISLNELYKQSTYTAQAWNFSQTESGVWAIRNDNKTLPYFQYQTASVVVEKATTVNAQLNLIASSDSIQVFKETETGREYLSTIVKPKSGTSYYSYPKVDIGNTLLFINYHKTDKQWAPSYPATAKVTEPGTGIAGVDIDGAIQIYPNPITDYFYIEGDFISAWVSVADLSGREIYKRLMKSGESVSLIDQPSGTYIITLVTDKETYTKKIIKQ